MKRVQMLRLPASVWPVLAVTLWLYFLGRTSGIAADFAVLHWSHLLYDAAQPCSLMNDLSDLIVMAIIHARRRAPWCQGGRSSLGAIVPTALLQLPFLLTFHWLFGAVTCHGLPPCSPSTGCTTSAALLH